MKTYSNILLNEEKLKSFSLKSRARQVCLISTLIQWSTWIPSERNKARKRNKGIQTGKDEVKLSLFANDMILHVKDPKDSTKKLTCAKYF
jgi:hypothetical protein